MAETLREGLFITFEGPEGCGKSTQSRILYEDLLSAGYECVYTAEPGGTPLGKKIREILLEKEDVRLDDHAELFLFEADRAQHVVEVILPALKGHKIVICDRFNTATFAYQGYGLGMPADLIKKIDAAATSGLVPDLTILLDIDVKEGLAKAAQKNGPDRMEKRDRTFHERVRKGYLAFAGENPDIVKIVKVRERLEETRDIIKKLVYEIISANKRTG